MSATSGGTADGLPWQEAELRHLVTLDAAAARAWLAQQGAPDDAGVARLCQAALSLADDQPDLAEAILTLGASLLPFMADEADARGQIAYAWARWWLVQGESRRAEESLLAAQRAWQGERLRLPRARSYLGLTQILAEQGRYAEAEEAIRTALAELDALAAEQPELTALLATAWRSLATLSGLQGRHADALSAFDQAIELLPAADDDPAAQQETAHLQLNRAISLMELDRIDEAAAALDAAIADFTASNDFFNRGRARTNLGALQAHTGQYGPALASFTAAADDLLGDLPLIDGEQSEEEWLARLRRGDVLLLEQGGVYLALNLLREAEEALGRAEKLFRSAERPYELGQTLLNRAGLQRRQDRPDQAQAALTEAAAIYARLDNREWQLRTRLAQAALALDQAQSAEAETLLNGLGPLSGLPAMEADLLRARGAMLRADAHQAAAALARVDAVLAEIGTPAALPHFRYRLARLRGRLALLRGDAVAARRDFYAAADIIERQRAALPIEEVRTAFLDDKADVYADLIATLLAEESAPSSETTFAVFSVVARAQSQTLLERLLVNLPDAAGDPELEERRQAIYRELHWLYNRLLSEGDSRRPLQAVTQAVTAREAVLQQIEWRRSPQLVSAAPPHLAELQAVLDADEQALVYYAAPADGSPDDSGVAQAGPEDRGRDLALVFVVDRDGAQVVRLAGRARLDAALREWRFQVGRAEVGPRYHDQYRDADHDPYRDRRHARLLQGARNALASLYDYLLAPVRPLLHAGKLLIIPHGPLHQAPFHALYDGNRHLIEEFECAYAPSIGVAVNLLRRSRRPYGEEPLTSRFVGFAPSEPTIPHTRDEVARAAARFARTRLFYAADAGRANFAAAAGEADILHVATHGLFRRANPYFSALKLADGWLDVRSLYAMPIHAELVVLSTCESGAGRVYGGGDVIGLARGFLGAGARRLIASLWNLHDAGAAELMDDFYGALCAQTQLRPAYALQQAQLAAIERGEHPYFWASFHAIE
ncbi:MAG: CHAT domain-containing protein [Caldilineaceae bacterium]|nr:CHAT domain-containing protein [Caldilineaceae bacterium]